MRSLKDDMKLVLSILTEGSFSVQHQASSAEPGYVLGDEEVAKAD